MFFYRRINSGNLRSIARLKNKWKDIDIILWFVPLLLVFIAGLLIASTQRQVAYADWYQHLIIAVFGVAIAKGLSRTPIERVRSLLIPIYGLTVTSLVAVRFVGTSALGAQRWLSVAGFNIQPSEFAKLVAIIVLASVLDGYQVLKPINLLKPLLVIFPLWLLVLFQPDLGTSLVFGAVLISMLYWSGMPFEWGLLSLSAIFTAIIAGLFPLGLLH